MKAEIDLEHVEKAMMFQSKEVTSCQQDEQIPQSDVCDEYQLRPQFLFGSN
jgi:NAD-dependent SIR2 family protein deacetylase